MVYTKGDDEDIISDYVVVPSSPVVANRWQAVLNLITKIKKVIFILR